MHTQYPVTKGGSPYKIKLAPNFKADSSDDMERAYFRNRAAEEAANNQHKQLIGNLDSLSSDFVSLFNTLTIIREKLKQNSRIPFLSKFHFTKIRILIKLVDKINSVIMNKIIPLIDELGK
jgi:hypothetical protein